MKKIGFEAANKKYSRGTHAFRYYWFCLFRNFQLFIRSFRIIARACHLGFNRTDLFFLNYFKLKDQHYKNDVKPVFEAWTILGIQPLEFHTPLRGKEFENLLIKTPNKLIQADRRSMGRSHLDGYRTNLNSVLDRIDEYNQKIHTFVQDFDTRTRQDITTNIPSLEEHNSKLDQQSNFYHFVNIPYYIWTKFWEESHEAELVITDYSNQVHELRISPGKEIIARSDDRDDISGLKKYIDKIAVDGINTIRQLNEDRNRIIPDFQTFTDSVGTILGNIAWNKPFKGRCGWERGYWSIKGSDL